MPANTMLRVIFYFLRVAITAGLIVFVFRETGWATATAFIILAIIHEAQIWLWSRQAELNIMVSTALNGLNQNDRNHTEK